jgi:GNAT superfamily N-acetyltransferase
VEPECEGGGAPGILPGVTAVPPGLDTRPLTTSDAPAAFDVLAAADEADLGFVGIDLDDVVADWGRPSFSLETDSVGVFEGERLVGCIEVYKGSRAVGAVHPNHRERGIGTALVAWSEEHARAKGSTTLAHAMAEASAGPDLLRRRAYQQRHTAWILRLGTGDDILGDRNLPPGVAIRPMQEGEEQATYRVVEDAFNEWEGRDPNSFDDWAATTLSRPGFQQWHMLVATQDGQVVGACNLGVSAHIAWVSELAVRRDQRGRGLGRLLLIDAFDRGRAAGATTFDLATDTRTGALGLYESVGMRIAATYLHFVLEL